ncbi:MAG: peptidoglycan-binding protein LysM [Candidatus Thiodiazotropha sp.]|jgi:nucleoid-associated protein YgaU
MGLFDFAADLGKKLFAKDDDPAEKIQQQIEANNPGIKNLDVAFENGKVTLSGNAESAEALEKTVLIAGNVQGVSEVTADSVSAPLQQAKVEYYTIERGDTLSAIAQRFLGKASDYQKIFEANREVIKDPDLIYPGQKIRIPLD